MRSDPLFIRVLTKSNLLGLMHIRKLISITYEVLNVD